MSDLSTMTAQITEGQAMSDLSALPAQITIEDQTIFLVSVLIDRIENQRIPQSENSQGWADYEKFTQTRAQTIFGKWPVQILNPIHNNKNSHFTGYRIICLCKGISPSDPSVVETAILVWHESTHCALLHVPENRIKNLKWSSLAEPVEW